MREQESFFIQFNTQKFKLQIKMLPTSWTVAFFDHQYLWKKLIVLLDFVHRNSHQRTDKFERQKPKRLIVTNE